MVIPGMRLLDIGHISAGLWEKDRMAPIIMIVDVFCIDHKE